jgi:hypothetical protein
MLTSKKMIVPTSEEVRGEAVQMLIKTMGITKAAIFIRENMAQKIDCLKVKDELFARKSAVQVHEEIKKGGR